MIQDRDPFAPDDDPTVLGPLAERDPDAPLEPSAEYVVTGAVSFDDVLRRARRQGFVAGAAAGGVAGALVAAVLALAMRPAAPAIATIAPADPPAPEPAEAAPSRARAPRAAAASGTEPRATEPAGPRPEARAEGVAAAAPAPEPGDGAADAAAAHADAVASRPPDARPAGDAASAEAQGDAASAEAQDAKEPAASDEAAQRGRPPREREVAAAISARRDDLEACVAETPGDGAAARGRRFRFLVVVDPSGQVSEARTYDEAIGATPLGVCLVRLARETTFPPFDGEPVSVEVRVHDENPE
ncbi:MAG TPA: hypothetical protein VFL83_22460 [Anaeromyxobacter sp.]|nr:hypothetical protein [Anaeromyxobacter sp.]